MIGAHEQAAGTLCGFGRVAVTVQRLPTAHQLGPGGLCVGAGQGLRRWHTPCLRGGCARPQACGQIGAQMCQRQRTRRGAGPGQHGRHAGMDLARQAVEHGRRRACRQRQDELVQRIACGQTVQALGRCALIAGMRRVGKGRQSRFPRELQRDIVRAVAELGIEIGKVGADRAKLPLQCAGAQDGVLTRAGKAALGADVDDRARQRCRTRNRDAVAGGGSRVGLDMVDRAWQ
ncbi:hypothetical protein D3C71_1447540 [compost metagenome]